MLYFYPRPPRGGRPHHTIEYATNALFLSTPSARRATPHLRPEILPFRISIHALREEGDPEQTLPARAGRRFLSTPSARRATYRPNETEVRPTDFYPRPPRGGRLPSIGLIAATGQISIHALREEGDNAYAVYDSTLQVFLSTPSARRATYVGNAVDEIKEISIHALREEGDQIRRFCVTLPLYFYPRPPRGGRRRRSRPRSSPSAFLSTPSARRATPLPAMQEMLHPISIHALREEGDRAARPTIPQSEVFLSTPSARRATAKTETKSLFSNKLYNILHEFRRALIYNGSKNDPNHAKRLKNPVRRCRKNAENSPFAPGRKTQNNSRPSCSKGG